MQWPRIVVVEEAPYYRDLFELALAPCGGFDVRTFASSACVLDRLSSFDADSVLLDVMMRRMDGPEPLSRWKERGGSGGASGFMTARSRSEELDRYFALGGRSASLRSRPTR